MKRRTVVIALGLSAMGPRRLFAQAQSKVRRVGFFYLASRQSAMDTGRYPAFLEGMRELGYLEGKDFSVEARFADGISERLPALAAELVRSNVDVIVSSGGPAAEALKRVTSTIPIVVTIMVDPVRQGLAASLARPGGNVTGLSGFLDEVFTKHVELLKLADPKLARIAALAKPGHPVHPLTLRDVEAVARENGIEVLRVGVDGPQDFERGFGTMAREGTQALIILGTAAFVQHFRQIAALAIKYRIASTYVGREYPEAGGFMSYGPNISDNYRRAASYVDKIIKGAKPAELPIEQPTRFYLTINRKTAKAIGLAIPQELLLRANEVIE